MTVDVRLAAPAAAAPASSKMLKGDRLSEIGYRAREGVLLSVACDPERCGFLQRAVSMKLLFSSSCKS